MMGQNNVGFLINAIENVFLQRIQRNPLEEGAPFGTGDIADELALTLGVAIMLDKTEPYSKIIGGGYTHPVQYFIQHPNGEKQDVFAFCLYKDLRNALRHLCEKPSPRVLREKKGPAWKYHFYQSPENVGRVKTQRRDDVAKRRESLREVSKYFSRRGIENILEENPQGELCLTIKETQGFDLLSLVRRL